MRHVLKCTSCSAYTMNEKCSCGAKAVIAKPAKYKPLDRYAKYRRKVKEKEWKKKGLL